MNKSFGLAKYVKLTITFLKNCLRISEIFRKMASDKRYGLSINLLATKVLPVLIPQLVNPQLQFEHFVIVHEVLQEMFDVIDR